MIISKALSMVGGKPVRRAVGQVDDIFVSEFLGWVTASDAGERVIMS